METQEKPPDPPVCQASHILDIVAGTFLQRIMLWVADIQIQSGDCHLAQDEIIKESLSGGDKPGTVREIPLPDPVSKVV